MTDFLDIVKPQLESLEDHPNGPPAFLSATTFPLDLENLEGQLRLQPENDGIPPEGADAASSEDIQAAKEVFKEAGLDILAFYKSFRFVHLAPFPGKWGIFLMDVGVAAVASEFRVHNPNLPEAEARRVARALLYEHERYHFWVDAWTLSQECAGLRPCIKRYEYYVAGKCVVALSDLDFEESLANSFAYRRLSRDPLWGLKGTSSMVRAFLRQCPAPYSNFDMAPKERRDAEGLLAGSVLSGLCPAIQKFRYGDRDGLSELNRTLGQALRAHGRLYPLSEPELCPTYWVHDPDYAARVQPYRAPDRREFRNFVEDYLHGRPDGDTDHQFYKIDNGEKIKFPNPHDKTIRNYERDNILRKAGMRLPEYAAARNTTNVWKKGCPRPDPQPPIK